MKRRVSVLFWVAYLVALGVICWTVLQFPTGELHGFEMSIPQALEDSKRHLLSKDQIAKQDHIDYNHGGIPACSIILPLYKASEFLHRLMDSLWQQTYSNLHLVVSIEPTDDAEETERILRNYEKLILSGEPTGLRSIVVYRQQNQMHYFANMNFLLTKINTPYYHYMQADDTLSPNFYEILINCLEENPQAVNCFAMEEIVVPDDDYYKKQFGFRNRTRYIKPLRGPQHKRVERLALKYITASNRGLVRRPLLPGQEFTYPRLHENFATCDQVMMLQQAIAGELLGANATYYKHRRSDALSSLKMLKAKHNFQTSVVDFCVQKYNIAHHFVAKSDEFVSKAMEAMKRFTRNTWKGLSGEVWPKDMNVGAEQEFLQRIRKPKRVAVLGAGIQGCLMALMFSKHGYDVALIDKAPDIMVRTSAVGEGRIHMGLEYANDPSMSTATFMLHSAMRFASYTEYLVGRPIDWARLRSERLTCLLPGNSHVSPEEFEAYGEKLGTLYEEILLEDPSLTYLGERPPKILTGRVDIPKAVNASYIQAAFGSIEVCILSNLLREIIREALAKAQIKIITNRTVVSVQRQSSAYGVGDFMVETDIGSNYYNVVVNALWENRAAIDRGLGINHHVDKESYRVKANVRLPNLLKVHGDIPSVSIMNGPFGDFVRYGPDDQVYFAWHPMSPKIISHNASTVLDKFKGHISAQFPPGYEQHMIDGHREAFKMIFPGYDVDFFDSGVVGTGYVVANGLSDIDDKHSGLHERKDAPNLVANGYISVKSQKLTNAPYNVYLLEKELFVKDPFSRSTANATAKE